MFKGGFGCSFKIVCAREVSERLLAPHQMQSQGGLTELVAEIHLAFAARQEEMNMPCDIIPATTHHNELGASDNSKLTSISSEGPSFAEDY